MVAVVTVSPIAWDASGRSSRHAPSSSSCSTAAAVVVARRPISSPIAPWAMLPIGYSAPSSIISTLTTRPRSSAGARNWATVVKLESDPR